MKSREERIAFDMNYCQHYETKRGCDISCSAGMDIATIQRVPEGPKGYNWGPCIGGHTLENPTEHCPRWIRRTREQGEARADAMQKAIERLTLVGPFVAAWRKKPPKGKSEIVECPACKGRLHLSQSSYNGHVSGKCETDNCVSWVE